MFNGFKRLRVFTDFKIIKFEIISKISGYERQRHFKFILFKIQI